jgi:hypothetical protein
MTQQSFNNNAVTIPKANWKCIDLIIVQAWANTGCCVNTSAGNLDESSELTKDDVNSVSEGYRGFAASTYSTVATLLYQVTNRI